MKYILLLLLTASFINAQTYEIAEPDMYDEIQSRKGIALKNLKKQKEEQIKKWKNYKGSILTTAKKDNIEYIDPTYTLTQDIPRVDKFGNAVGVLFKKGYTFNPLSYVKITPPDMIVFNACIKEEAIKVKELINTKYKYKTLMLVNSGCKADDFVDKYFKGKTYFLTNEMVTKFKLKETISIVSVDLNIKRIKIETFKTVE